ncbi:Hypothetical predicted protein [Mytilus galloprovincialis]|uniref:Novel STAND NTPase 3 domain-containing protein n=1 Tax=Mytilus galloprovincialis TaxID=29158 RepID=A0A8B6HIV5_MYTGA|nr:Hypothetical predicted protein [Mytilus galloprovincialis]
MSEDLYKECERLQITGLDLLNKDIELRILKAFKEWSDIKRIHKLHKELEILKKSKSNPILPKTRVKFARQLDEWRKDDNYFVSTKGSKAVFEAIKNRPCVAVTGSFGIGKTAILHNVALLMDIEGFIVVPVSSPWEIEKYNHPVRKNLFVVDNFCGKINLDVEELNAWKKCGVLFDKQCKLLVSCQLHIYKPLQRDKPKKIRFYECNLHSKDICLSITERQSIADEYDINKNEIKNIIEYYNCFPLLCTYFHKENISNLDTFFNYPVQVFKAELEKLQAPFANGKVCALMTLLMFHDNVPETMFTGRIKWDDKYILSNTSKACNLDTKTSYHVIHEELENFIDTYVMKKDGVYHALNNRMFDILAYHFSHQMTVPLVKYSCPSFIKDWFQLPRTKRADTLLFDHLGKTSELVWGSFWSKPKPLSIVLASTEGHILYVNRMLADWSKGNVTSVFQNQNVYHALFFKSLNNIDGIELRQLLEKNDIYDGNTPIIVHCSQVAYTHAQTMHDVFLEWLINNGCPINKANNKGETAVFHATFNNNLNLIDILMRYGANIDTWTTKGTSALYVACLKGYVSIAKRFLQSGAKCNMYSDSDSPLFAACSEGHTSIVIELLKFKANVNEKNRNGYAPLHIACGNGHSEIVTHLLQVGANCNILTHDFDSPFHFACLQGNISIVTELLQHNAKISRTNTNGLSPLYVACHNGHYEIVQILLRIGADCNTHAITGDSPLMVACIGEYTSIVSILLQYDANVNKKGNLGNTPLHAACYKGHYIIARQLLQVGADCNSEDKAGFSPLHIACNGGHISIVKELLRHNANVRARTKNGLTPIDLARLQKHSDIEEELINYSDAIR